ncbi:hypothetical protein PAH45_11565 [Klebsiella quasipneumoniae]|uniref:hypothetical protein n=1 Tax=Klebsiella quasipneumoniae TaxID=1463165 RepID=UPI0028519FAD|nr:hypothetical protein [Klebsiella quasipneumoniae]MDR4842420.1 hypothetical protein [Klebsiella quasipneumoniae]
MINTRSGTRIAVNDTSIQDSVDIVYPPVLSGLAQALFFTAGGDGKNYAPTGKTLPEIIGAPTQNAFSKSFPTITDCVDTGLLDNSDYTVLIVNKPTPLPAGMIYRPFFGNWNAATVEAGKGAGLGSAVIQIPNSTLTIVTSSVPVADAANPSAATSIRENVNLTGLGYGDSTWRFSAFRVTTNSFYFKDFTKNVEQAPTAFRAGYVKDNRRAVTLRVSGQYGAVAETCSPGPEAALMLFYRRGLTDDEMSEMYTWAKKYCDRRGITI